MKKKPVDEFAESLVENVRDNAIDNCLMYLSPTGVDPVTRRWQAHISVGVDRAALEEMIADCVDSALFQLLDAVDNGTIPLYFRNAKGLYLDLREAGGWSMAGSYLESGGWRQKYSRKHVVDDFSDLADPGSLAK